jgi:ribosome-binding factor A
MAEKPPSTRRRRANVVLREIVAETVGRELSDPRLGFVTITDVEASPDLSVATVYFTTLKERQREPSMQALESAAGLLQGRIGKSLGTRNTPKLRFVYDQQQDVARRISRLIDEAGK